MIVTYNKEQVGDVLMLTLKNSGDAKDFQDKSQKLQETLRAANQEVQKAAEALGKKYSQ